MSGSSSVEPGGGTAFGLTPAQRDFSSWVRRTAGDLADVPPVHGAVNRPLIGRLGELGLLRRLFGGEPDQEDHSSASQEPPRDAAAMQLCLLREGLAEVNTEAETALALQGLGSYPILQAGRDATRRRWLPGVVSGDVVPAFALSEPDAGSDAGALALEARPDGDGWTLHGTKTWISNAPDADVYTVFARTTPGAGARGVTAFAVPGDAPGLSGERLDMVAPHALGTVHVDGVRVSRDDLLGEVDGGFGVAMRTLDLFRPSVGAFAVGMAQAALDASLAWATERRAVRRPADRPAGDPAHARGDGDADRGRPAARTPRGCGLRRGRRRRRRSPPARPRRSSSRPRPPSGWSTRPSSSTAHGDCSGATCWSGSIVRCERPGSTRAPPRCSGRSSPADS